MNTRINILQWILTELGTYLVLQRIWNPMDFQGHQVKFLGEGICHALRCPCFSLILISLNNTFHINQTCIQRLSVLCDRISMFPWKVPMGSFDCNCTQYDWIVTLSLEVSPSKVYLMNVNVKRRQEQGIEYARCLSMPAAPTC